MEGRGVGTRGVRRHGKAVPSHSRRTSGPSGSIFTGACDTGGPWPMPGAVEEGMCDLSYWGGAPLWGAG